MSTKNLVLTSGKRKYVPILEALIAEGKCIVQCIPEHFRTIMDGVKKEKVVWVKRGKWPDGKAMKIEPGHDHIEFKMVTDTSIRNL